MNMKNKDKYDLRTLEFRFSYSSYFDEVNVHVLIGDENVAEFKGKGFSGKKIIMDWLERESDD